MGIGWCKSAWKDKIGTSGEINLILINLLKDAGIKVRPILVSTRENGIIITSVAGYDQFDKVMAYVDIADKHYVLDATEQETPSHLIPLNVQASEGLLISKLDNFEWGWTVLWNDKNKFAKAVFINADLDSKGKMSGIAKVTSYDYEKMKDLKDYRKGTDKLKELKITQAGLTVDSLTVEGADVDSLPLVQEFKFTAPTNSSGDYNYFSLNYFTGFEKNPFLSEERRTEIFYGALQDYSISALVYLPEGYVMDELPPNMKMITSDSSIIFKRYVSQGDGFLNVQVTLKFKNPIYSVEAYPEINEFFKKMYALLDEKFVYKKK
ncbi:MAG: hypothetical protein IPP48_16045 [Chitinophagaceae bacterium]|nr:hypothetical protein [Chitinophagaceae bacterium]